MVGTGISRTNDTAPSARLTKILRHLRNGGRLWLLLDYDGTLVPVAPTPAEAVPDPGLLELLSRLVQIDAMCVAVVSGRSLASLKPMLPVPNLILAGIYGVEIQIGEHIESDVLNPQEMRKKIDEVKSAWAQIIVDRPGFWLEDKRFALALHGRFADPPTADIVFSQAREKLAEIAVDEFRILGGERFLEIAPASASKGKAVEWLLEHMPLADALPVYFGDDDKDEEAFLVVKQLGGIPIGVGKPRSATTHAVERLASPSDLRMWLESFLQAAP
ncbi:MAG: trehalose-phosphatase [Chloroflexi bacterium]|nr:trehalose-phosphatase [Chloroflexota bacterium]